MADKKLTLKEFGAQIKAKHPAYAARTDEEVARAVLAKYPQYAARVESEPAATIAGARDKDPGLLDQLANWGAHEYPHVTPEMEKGKSGGWFGPSVDRFVDNTTNQVLRNLTSLPAAAVDKIKDGLDPDQILHPFSHAAKGFAEHAAGGTPVSAKDLPHIKASDVSDYASEKAGDLGTGILLSEVGGGLLKAPGAIKRAVRGDVDTVIPGTTFTPRERYQSAKRLGVDLPPAQATNSPILTTLDKYNHDGLLSGHMHEKLAAKNRAALTGTTDSMLQKLSPLGPEEGGQLVQDKLKAPFIDLQNRANDTLHDFSPLSREQGGARIQSLAQTHMDDLHADAQGIYQGVQDAYGKNPLNDPGAISKVAKEIRGKNSRFQEQFPALDSRKVSSVLDNAAELGNPDQIPSVKSPTVGDVMRSRSALLDLTRDPEIVKSSFGADVQRLIKAHDDAITQSLPEEGQQAWRAANQKWETMKNQYDSPQSPYFHALRTPAPSTLAEGVGGPTPEAVQQLRDVGGDEATGIVAKNVGEKLMGRTGTGEYDLGNFATRFERLPAEYRNELFGNNGEETMGNIGKDANALAPFRKAAYTADPESLVNGIGPETAGGVRTLRDLPVKPEGAEGPAAPRIGEDAMGAVRKGVATDLLGTTATGGYNFPTFAGKLERLNDGYKSELFGPETEATLNDIGRTSNALDTDYNRSGSGKLAQKVVEGTAIGSGLSGALVNPAAAIAAVPPLLQYPLGKFMTSPAASDWLMKPAGGLYDPKFALPVATAGSLNKIDDDDLRRVTQ